MKTQFSALAIIALAAAAVPAQPIRGEGASSPPSLPRDGGVSAEALPVKNIVLFTGGVGHFLREGRVDGSGKLELQFGLKDVSDLLKSLVIRDFDGGKIRGVTYASRDPLERTLKSFSLDLSGSPGLPDILGQARGETVEVEAERRHTGKILAVESRPSGEGEGEKLFLTILSATPGDEGIRSIPFDGIRSLRFTRGKLNDELEAALGIIADMRNTDRKSVWIDYQGTGSRRLQAGYVLETPVWKTSYRLVIDPSGRHLLQGWAVVENATDEDWNGVRLDLVSGAPVSFAMDLYQPLYNPRPFVPYAVRGNLQSRTHDEGLAGIAAPAEAAPAPAPSARFLNREAAALSKAMAAREEDQAFYADSAPAAAEAEAVGEFFRYTIGEPVSLPRRRSGMIPILNETIPGERVSIYNPEVHGRHPMNGLRLTNSSALSLMAGPVTVFEEGIYAGDARIDDLRPGAKRLVSFSLDLDTEVMRLDRSLPELITRLSLRKGVLQITKTLRRETAYTLINRGDKSRAILVEHPASPDWKLAEPASFQERTEDLYRFAVATPAGRDKTTELRVAEERVVESAAALSSMGADTVLFYASQKGISGKVREALNGLAKKQAELAEIVRQKKQAETRIAAIHREQERIRGNMAGLDRASALYQRYVSTLGEQETALTALTGELDGLQVREMEKKKEIDDFLGGLEAF